MNSHYKNLFELKGKTALVTGAVGILGQRFCRGLAEFGAQVVVADLDQARCTAFADELRQDYATDALGVGCDVADPTSVANLVAQAVARFGGIHILHNNAASKSADLDAFFASTEEYSLAEWRKIMSVNVDGMFLVAQAVGGQMQKQGRGGQHHPDCLDLRHRLVRQTHLREGDRSTWVARSVIRPFIRPPRRQ